MSLDNDSGDNTDITNKVLDENNFIISRNLFKKLRINFEFKSGSRFEYIDLARNVIDKLYASPELYSEIKTPIFASDILGIWTLKKAFSYILDNTILNEKKDFEEDFSNWYSSTKPSVSLDTIFTDILSDFPPHDLLVNNKITKKQLQGYSQIGENKKKILVNSFIIWLIHSNPTKAASKDLIGYTQLSQRPRIEKFFNNLVSYIKNDSWIIENDKIIDFLSRPFDSSSTIKEQLSYIKDKWKHLLGPIYDDVVQSIDIINEEEKSLFMGGLGPGPTQVLDFSGVSDADYEAFSSDSDWMPNVVLLAKTAYVWLHQLSKKYKQSISRLDQIPNEELNEIASRGFNALWLIGVWERSQASKKIKHSFGSTHAEASAYSIFNYRISGDLGGDEAVRNLKHRALQRGIQLAGDMVPNHTGIDSLWIREHPDWFIYLDNPPYPSYSFNGQNLSDSPDISIFLEDHYYSKSDAAVVFKRVDNHTGDVKYIYHGNDGTSMPWNDTAQLNYLKKEVREAVAETILRVADLFPIIRFDAAMVLTRRHIQRLWFPEPGSGGAIPSRSEHTVNVGEFNSALPNEFWREVVDLIKERRPNTLLLAEAFWLLEGYFVRTLGMHRVYNSAFMNMLKNEENEKFRQTIINTIEYSPEILKRFVNFMNNPDEDTAFAQFGKDDKYFGTCVLLSTLPGLPMFGHGQIEGFTEKYGMEFRYPFQEESPDDGFVDYHNRTIFPLLRKRALFSEVTNFVFYNVIDEYGSINHNIIAYSNKYGNEKALVIYNNKYDSVSGRIHYSWDNFMTLASAFDLEDDDTKFTIFYDQITGLEYIRPCKELYDKGLIVLLKGFGHHVFFNFNQVVDNKDKYYQTIFNELNGAGTKSISYPLMENQKKEKETIQSKIEKKNKKN